jgi:hypothetical protein
MWCGVCGDPTDQMKAERRDLGGDDPEFVCPDCQDLADDVTSESDADSGIGSSGTSGRIGTCSEQGSDSSDSDNGVTTKYAI